MNSKKIFLLLLFTFSILKSQNNTYEFLRVDLSPRASAMGGSFVANNDDVDVIFYNPAGIYDLQNIPVSFSFVKHLLDINLASFSISQEFEGIGRFGAGVKYINYGSFTGADEYGNKLSEYGAGEVAFIVGYSNILDENFSYGSNIKFIYSKIENYNSTAIAFDLGLQYSIPELNWNFGFSIMNIGTQLSSYINTKEKLPLDIVIGVSKKLQYLPLRFYLDFHKLNDNSLAFFERVGNFTFGGEFTLSKVLKMRLGYDNEKRKELKIGSFSGLAGFNIGLGFNVKDYTINYSYSSLGVIGAMHRIGVNTIF